MKNIFIPYELAVIAKEKGFNEQTLAFYTTTEKELIQIPLEGKTVLNHLQLKAPLYQQILDWLREEHNLFIEISLEKYGTLKIEIKGIIKLESLYCNCYTSKENYYEALNKSIEEALKLT
jgi:hypothetical protein